MSEANSTTVDRHGLAVADWYAEPTIAVLLGLSQIVLSFAYMMSREFVILAGGGWFLVALGLRKLSTSPPRDDRQSRGVLGSIASLGAIIGAGILVVVSVQLVVAG